MRVKITDANLLLQPETPQDLVQICSMLGDGKQRTVRVDAEAVKAACISDGIKALDVGLGAAEEALGTGTPPTDADGDLDRNAIKAELNKLGVAYNNRWGTVRLAAFLAEQRAGGAVAPPAPATAPAASVGDPAPAAADDDPLAEPATAAVTKDQVLQALKNIVATKGKEEGTPLVKSILTAHGAANLSGIAPEQYKSVVEAALAVK